MTLQNTSPTRQSRSTEFEFVTFQYFKIFFTYLKNTLKIPEGTEDASFSVRASINLRNILDISETKQQVIKKKIGNKDIDIRYKDKDMKISVTKQQVILHEMTKDLEFDL